MIFAKLAIVLAIPLLVALSALPKVLIERAARRHDAQAVADFRDTLPDPADGLDPEQIALDAKWEAYWAGVRREGLGLLAGLDARAADIDAAWERAENAAAAAIKDFAANALNYRQAYAARLGGWRDETERQAILIYKRAGGSLHVLNHQLRVEIAECTDTRWTDEDARMLREHIEAEQAAGAGRHRAA